MFKNNIAFSLVAILSGLLALIFEIIDIFNGKKDIHLPARYLDEDNKFTNRLIFFLSKLSNLNLLAFILLFIFKVNKIKINNYLMIFAPVILATNFIYYYKLYNFKKYNFIDQKFKNFFSHFLVNIFLIILITFSKNLKELNLVSIIYFYLFFLFYFFIVIINKIYRKIWPYGSISDLTKKEGLKNLTLLLTLSQIFAICIFFYPAA